MTSVPLSWIQKKLTSGCLKDKDVGIFEIYLLLTMLTEDVKIKMVKRRERRAENLALQGAHAPPGLVSSFYSFSFLSRPDCF